MKALSIFVFYIWITLKVHETLSLDSKTFTHIKCVSSLTFLAFVNFMSSSLLVYTDILKSEAQWFIINNCSQCPTSALTPAPILWLKNTIVVDNLGQEDGHIFKLQILTLYSPFEAFKAISTAESCGRIRLRDFQSRRPKKRLGFATPPVPF